MADKETIQTIRALIGQGDMDEALRLLIGLLEKDARFKGNLLRTVRIAEVNYNTTREQAQKDIIPFQEAKREYSQIADTLLAVLEDCEEGRVRATALPPAGNRRLWMWAGVGGAIVLLGVLAFWLMRNDCPKFENKEAFHIVVMPFENLGGAEAKPAQIIQNSIQELTQKAGIAAEVKIFVRGGKSDDLQHIEKSVEKCDADLVIFGQYERASPNDSIRVRTGFKFFKDKDKDGRPLFSGPFRAFRDVTAVQPTRDLQDAVFMLCTMIAVREKNWQFAKRWVGRIREKNQQEMIMGEWLDKQ